MPRKQPGKLPAPKLTKSPDEVARILQSQINTGRELLTLQTDTPSALAEAQEKLKSWYHKNKHYLDLLFDNTSKLDDYRKAMLRGPVILVGPPVERGLSEEVQDHREWLSELISRLETILQYVQTVAELEAESRPVGHVAPSAVMSLQGNTGDMYPEHGERSLTMSPKKLPDQEQRRDGKVSAQAFFSYAHFDDKHEQKQLSKLRERLAEEVRTQTGQRFEIFQDRISIRWGQKWEQRIDQTLEDEVTFLIPILTPSYFSSEACRKELELFLKREAQLGRHDLILPILYVDCPMLNDKSKREKGALVQEIAARQYADWRDLRFSPLNSQAVRKTLAELAKQIRDAFGEIRGE